MKETATQEKKMPNSEELEALLDFITNTLSKELPTLLIDPDYFILGVLTQRGNLLYKRLTENLMSTSIDAIYTTFYQVVSSKALTAVKKGRVPIYDKTMQAALTGAENEALSMGDSEITSEHVFLSILADENKKNNIRKVFNKAGITYNIMKEKMSEDVFENGLLMISVSTDENGNAVIDDVKHTMDKDEIKRALQAADRPENLKKSKSRDGQQGLKFIKSYCIDLCDMAKKHKIDPLVGREKEVQDIFRTLGRKKKNNAILVGGEGVGKTAIGESIAIRLITAKVPDFLLGRKLISLDMTALMAGTTLRGMFEERVKGLMDEIKANPEYILFMDNIGAILADKGKNDYELSAMLSRSLENGEIQVIGTSDFKSYRATFDKDPSLSRKFQKIVVEPSTVDESIEILKGLKETYEDFHHVRFDDDTIETCVRMADKYLTERNLPDSAIDLMDEAGAVTGTINESNEVMEARARLSEVVAKLNNFSTQGDPDEFNALKAEAARRGEDFTTAIRESRERKYREPIPVTKEDILNLVSAKTSIPVSSLTSDDKKKLLVMNERLKKDVIGQDEAIDTICRALKRNRIGLRRNGCMYGAMMIGRSGVGKTLVAKKLAKELFGSENALVRFDMSEYSDKVAVNKLIGSNPGYVGYEEGGQLTNAIRNRKHCVLLLDEIEKADPEIYNIFLQVLDEGFLTDNSGMKVDFKNVIVLFTSNVGAKAASEFGRGIGFSEDEDKNSKKILLKQLKSKFPPEFLNRIDDVIYFNALTQDNLRDIIKIEIEKFEKNLKDIGYAVEYDDSVVDAILDEIRDEREYGARTVGRTIQDSIEAKITDAILANNYENGHKFKLSCAGALSTMSIS